MGRHGGAPSLNALIKETQTRQYTAALHVGDFAYDLATDGGEVRMPCHDMTKILPEMKSYCT